MKPTSNATPGNPEMPASGLRRAFTRAEMKAHEQELMNRKGSGLTPVEEMAMEKSKQGEKGKENTPSN